MAWTPRTPTTASWEWRNVGSPDFLLKEDGGKLLQESGFWIILEQSDWLVQPAWAPRTIPTI